MPTISLLTSDSTSSASDTRMQSGQVAVARSSSAPALFITNNNSNIGISPSIYDTGGFATGKPYQLVFRTSDKVLDIYNTRGDKLRCAGGLQGITNADTTLLGVLPTTGQLTPTVGFTCVAPLVPLGGGTSQSVVVYPGQDRALVPDSGNVSIGGQWLGDDTTAICPSSEGGQMPAYYPTVIGGIGGKNIPTYARLTAIGFGSTNAHRNSDYQLMTTVGELISGRPTNFTGSNTILNYKAGASSSNENTQHSLTCIGIEQITAQASGYLEGISLGANVTPANKTIFIGATGWIPAGSQNSANPLIAIWASTRPPLPKAGISVGNRASLSLGDLDTVTLGTNSAMRLAINSGRALSFSSPSAWGTTGQILSSVGTGGPPVWKSGPTYAFTSADGKFVSVTNGLITSIS